MSKPFIEGYIYAVLCLTTGDRYVGQSTRMYMIKTYHGKFGNNLGKVKQKLFKKDILENHITNKSELNQLEQKYIAEYRELYGLEVMHLNKDAGGSGIGAKHSFDTCKLIGRIRLGVKQTEEHRKNNSESKLGKQQSIETIKSKSKSCLIDGIEYYGQTDAANKLNKHRSLIKRRLNDPNFPNYIRL